MAFASFAPIQNRSGIATSSALVVPSGLTSLTVRLDSTNFMTSTAFANTAVTLQLDVAQSSVGPWDRTGSDTFIGGPAGSITGAKSGQLLSGQNIANLAPYPKFARGSYSVTSVSDGLSTAARFGLSGEIV